jgi:phenylpyruvate tautomerase PptA (4-oxalocrotonate tautomerase family)
MPTYTCTTSRGLLSAGQKSAIAAAVTETHGEITGAPAYFAQVIFQEVNEGDHFIGGRPLGHDHIFVYGQIRSGRSVAVRTALMKRLVEDVAVMAKVEAFSVWVYLLELSPAAMAEFGHILPEAGDEQLWTEALPAEDRVRMLAISRTDLRNKS